MTFDLNDLKNAIFTIVLFFVCLGIQQYWSHRRIKSIRRRIEQTEAYKANVNNLAKSDRALLIYGFEGVFAVLGLISLVFLIQIIFGVIRAGMLDDLDMVLMLLWFAAGAVCIGVIMVLRDVTQYPESIDKIETLITKLKNKLLGREK